MSRRNSRDNDGSDDEYSDYESRRGGNRATSRPQQSEREPEAPRKRPQPPPTRRSHDIDDEAEERRPPANRDVQERRPPPDRGDSRNRDVDREAPRAGSRERPVERIIREHASTSRSRERTYYEDESNAVDRRRAPAPAGRSSSRDRGDDRADSRDRGNSRGDSRDRTNTDEEFQNGNGLDSRDRAVRSSREGSSGVDVRRSREAPKGFTPKSYTAAPAWNSEGGGSSSSSSGRQFEQENKPLGRGDSWTSSGQHRPPPSAPRRSHYRTEDDSDDEVDDRRGGRAGPARARSDSREKEDWRGDRDDRDAQYNTQHLNRGARDVQGLRDHDRKWRDADREQVGSPGPVSGRKGRGQEEMEPIDLEESQDNNIKAFSVEKAKKPAAPRRQHSPDQGGVARKLDRDEDEYKDRRRDRADSRDRPAPARGDSRDRYEPDEGDDYDLEERESTGGGGRKWQPDEGITSLDMKRLDTFRKSGRYGGSGSDDNIGKSKAIYNFKPSGNVPLVNYCPPNGGHTDLFQCYIVRERNSISSKLYPTYKLYSQEGNKQLILARKMGMNSTSNYHLFDMTRGIPEKTNLSKKSGNYIGKLRGIDSNHSEYVLVTKSEDKHEVAAIQFDRLGLVSQLKEGCQPRKMNILLPNISADNEPIPHQLKHTDSSKKKPKSLATLLRRNDCGNMFNLVSKDPIYENGNYRLNFHGRVSIPSVKNFQLTTPDDIDDVVCQFGKIAEETFNLDFKYPLNPFQAFSLALCHFDA